MSKEDQTDPRKHFVPRYLPWLLAGSLLLVYLCTLNHWITLLNVNRVAMAAGWSWQPSVVNPLTYLVTLPFRCLPVALVPVALNVFSALCIAASLGLLARSVAILPHDRTEMERTRERSDFSFLTGWVAWIPPVAAVIFAGLQLGFWEQATNFTGESFDLLWFAIIIWQLLEYRLDESENRLFLTALLYGAGLAENWAMLGFFPIYLIVIVWLRKLDFLNSRFLLRMSLWGLAGLSLLLFLPIKDRFTSNFPVTLWDVLRVNLRADWQVVRLIEQAGIRHDLALMALTSLVPALIMSIRWSSSYGDSSRLGAMLVNYMMHGVSAMLLFMLVWLNFDPPFSPHQLLQEFGSGVPGLTFYYLAALCLGYFCGYGLLVFGVAPKSSRRTHTPEPALPQVLLWLCPLIVGFTLAALGMTAFMLAYKNAPIVRAANDDSLRKYAQFTAQKLPPGGGILLCDSDVPGQDLPTRGFLLQAELTREGREKNYLVVDTDALKWPSYHLYLHKQHPKLWPELAPKEMAGISPLVLLKQLSELSLSNNLCYLNPSFGEFFEQFYLEPHGLLYTLKILPNNTLLPPPLDQSLMAENESFWNALLADCQPSIEAALHPVDLTQKTGFVGWFMRHAHVVPEANPNAALTGTYYSRSMNYLGVQEQRAGELDQAEALFNHARDLNSNNVVAGINLAFNKSLRAGSPAPVDLSRVTSDQFGRYHNWNEVLTANGPFDETSFCFENGVWLMQMQMMRQAVASFNRVRQLMPDNLAARLFLAQIYLTFRQADQALEVLHDPLAHPDRFALTEFNSTEFNVVAATAYFQKNQNAQAARLLDAEMDRHPDDNTLLLASTQTYFTHGLYTNALKAINRKLARSPNDPPWLYGKGFASLQIGDYDTAIAALTQVLAIQTNNSDALYNRGFAYYQSGQLDAAGVDFRKLQTLYTNNFQVAYGLGEIARRQHNTNEALRNYQIYLAHAPTNAVEYQAIREHQAKLRGQ
jgi:tetratricopeptide (TPR) repeat protein